MFMIAPIGWYKTNSQDQLRDYYEGFNDSSKLLRLGGVRRCARYGHNKLKEFVAPKARDL